MVLHRKEAQVIGTVAGKRLDVVTVVTVKREVVPLNGYWKRQ